MDFFFFLHPFMYITLNNGRGPADIVYVLSSAGLVVLFLSYDLLETSQNKLCSNPNAKFMVTHSSNAYISEKKVKAYVTIQH